MFEPKRLHPITIAFSIIKNIKDVIIPFVIYIFLFVLRDGKDDIIQIGSESAWLRASPIIFLGVALLIMVTSALVKWLRYTYRVEDMELRIEHGLFIKKKRYIPFERIQSLDFSESVLHRPFGLVKVKVETAGGNLDQSEAEMSAIYKEDAIAIKNLITEAKSSGKLSEDEQSGDIGIAINESILYKITNKQLLFFASTSGRAGVIVSAIIAFFSQFQDFIPFDKIFKEMAHIARAGYILLSIIVIAVLLFSWLLSVIIAYLKYNDFTLKQVEDNLVITRGLLEKRTTTIPLRRIQAVKITESPLRQPFGYASVAVEYAGGSITDDKSEGLLMPVVKKRVIGTYLEEALSDYSFNVDLISAPKRAKHRFYFVKLIQTFILAAVLSIWLWPYGLLSCILVGGAWVLGEFQFRSAGWNITDSQLVCRYRDFQQQTVFMKKDRMQSLDISENWFQKRAQLATVATAVMSGGVGAAGVRHIEKEDARVIYEWYRRKIAPEESE